MTTKTMIIILGILIILLIGVDVLQEIQITDLYNKIDQNKTKVSSDIAELTLQNVLIGLEIMAVYDRITPPWRGETYEPFTRVDEGFNFGLGFKPGGPQAYRSDTIEKVRRDLVFRGK